MRTYFMRPADLWSHLLLDKSPIQKTLTYAWKWDYFPYHVFWHFQDIRSHFGIHDALGVEIVYGRGEREEFHFLHAEKSFLYSIYLRQYLKCQHIY